MKGMKNILAVAVLAFAPLCVRADASATINTDGRGLLNVVGICRQESKAHWGFVNLVTFGPSWQFAAQDYACKGAEKGAVEDPTLGKGLLFTAKMWTGARNVNVREESYDVTRDGVARAHVRWTLSSDGGKPLGLQRAYAMIPLPVDDFAGGKVGATTLPAAFVEEFVAIAGDSKTVEAVSKDGRKRLHVEVLKGNVVVADARKNKSERFELRVEFPDCAKAGATTIEFVIGGTFVGSDKKSGRVDLTVPPPPYVLAAGADWTPFPYANEIKPGTILDFTGLVSSDAPAGKDGFVRVAPDGHLTFEKAPGRRIRLVGGNLCFDANFLSKEQVDRAVRDFRMRGWNAMRLHHIDVTITKDEWNKLWERKTMPELSPKKLDQLDYLMAECKKAGIYLTLDLYAMGSLGSCEGFEKPLNSNTVKAAVPIHKPAEDQWFKRAMELFDHVNPYTGVAWKDEPQIAFVTLMNEDAIASVWWGAADLYVEKYNEWAAASGCPKYPKKGIGSKPEFARFLHETKAAANRRMAKRLRDAGVKTLVSGGNWWDTMAQTFEREALDVVDNHQYCDHPQPSYQNPWFHVNQTSSLRDGGAAYATPIMKAPTRVFGKPFAVTEYNYCMPNKTRAEGGLMMGAYAALQDWDGLFRFAWSHSRDRMFKPSPVKGFDIACDPIGQMTERQVVLLFGRGDVARAKRAYAYGVTMDEATKKGLGDMWSKGLFPHPFTQLAYVSRIGSFVADGGRKCSLPGEDVVAMDSRSALPKFTGAATSDTGEVAIDRKAGSLSVVTPRSAAVCVFGRALAAGPLAVADATTFCSVSASAMDGAALEKSKRVLLFHLTDVQSTDAKFGDKSMRDMKSQGKLPYLARVGSAQVTLRNANRGLKLWALASDGTRLREVPATYADGAYRFTARVAPGEGANQPTMMYELAEK